MGTSLSLVMERLAAKFSTDYERVKRVFGSQEVKRAVEADKRREQAQKAQNDKSQLEGGANMKKRLPGLISILGLAVAFLVFRFPLFRIHGMKEWPLWLFVFGAIVITIFGIALHNNTLSEFVVIGYVLGFFISYLFQFDYGIGLNSMWIIWTCSYMAIMLAGAVVAIVRRNHRKKH